MCCCQEQAVASLELGVSGCLFAELASQQPGAAGCNYALQLQRKLLAAERVLGPAARWLLGFREQWRQRPVAEQKGGADEGEDRQEERARAAPGAGRGDTRGPGPLSMLQTENQRL